MDFTFYFIMNSTCVFTIMLFIVKVVLFLQPKNKNWTFEQFVYFDTINIKLSRRKSARQKRIQNILTVFILFLSIITILLKLLFADIGV